MRPGFILFLLTLGQIIMYADRGYVSGVLPLIQSSLGTLTDSSLGVLGSAFVIGYALSCPLFAFASQTISSYKLISIGLALWCFAVFVCGATEHYGTLLIARVITGVGEASLLGLGPTCIDDIAPPSQRTIWLSVFFSSLPLGGALGYVFGGLAVHLGLSWHQGFLVEFGLTIPLLLIIWFIPPSEPQDENREAKASPLRRLTQPCFENSSSPTSPHTSIFEKPNFLHAIPTPPRVNRKLDPLNVVNGFDQTASVAVQMEKSDASSSRESSVFKQSKSKSSTAEATALVDIQQPQTPFNRALTHTSTFMPRRRSSEIAVPALLKDNVLLADNVKTLFTDLVYIFLVLGYSALAFVTGALSFWAPLHFSRLLNISLSDSTRAIGGITFICGLLGTGSGGLIMDTIAIGARNKKLAIVKVALQLCCVFTFISIAFATISIYVKSAIWSLSCLGIAQFFIFGVGAPINAALLSISPVQLRSLAMSVSILIMHLLGDLPSPFVFGLVNDLFNEDMRISMAMLCCWLLWSVVFWYSASEICKSRLKKLKKELKEQGQLLIDPKRLKYSAQTKSSPPKHLYDQHVSYATFEQTI